MDKQTEDNKIPDRVMTPGQDPDRYEQGYGSFKETDFDEEQPGNTEANKKTEDGKKENTDNNATSTDKPEDANSTSS